jgi:hypothetical protein
MFVCVFHSDLTSHNYLSTKPRENLTVWSVGSSAPVGRSNSHTAYHHDDDNCGSHYEVPFYRFEKYWKRWHTAPSVVRIPEWFGQFRAAYPHVSRSASRNWRHVTCVKREEAASRCLSSSSSSSLSSSPLCRVFTLVFLKQTVSIGNSVAAIL